MASRSLPILMALPESQRWSCHSCGTCCHKLTGHLLPHERDRLASQRWKEELGVEPYVRVAGQVVLNKRENGACVFLMEDNRCLIHARHGEAAKPLACRIFPFSVRQTRRGWRVSLRFDCPSVTGSQGERIRRHEGWIGRLAGELPLDRIEGGESAALSRAVVATERELELILTRYAAWISRTDLPLDQRLIIAARFTELLSRAKFDALRHERIGDLFDVLAVARDTELAGAPDPPTRRQRGMLRQLAFAHAEHATLMDLAAGWSTRLRLRLSQLRRAGSLRRGRGRVPRLPGFPAAPVSFDHVDAVVPAGGHEAGRTADLIGRYLQARLGGWTVFGGGYYGWPVWSGMTALWLAIAVVGWLARLGAAADGRPILTFDDTAHALGIVDRAVTRLPALGSLAERARVRYLLEGDGVARLLGRYNLTERTL